MTNKPLNTGSVTNKSFNNDLTWDEADFTWDEASGTWDNPYVITNKPLNTGSVTNKPLS